MLVGWDNGVIGDFFSSGGYPGTVRYSYISLGRRFRLYVYEAILYLNHMFGTVIGKKKRNHNPNGHSETRIGYSNPFFQNFPTDFLLGM